MNHTNIPEKFDNLQQRSVSFFLNTMPSFKAVKDDRATKKEQENAYNFIKGIYEKLYNDPLLLLGNKLVPDDCYANWQPRKEKPKLTQKIRANSKKISEFMGMVFHIVYNGEVENNTVTLSKTVVHMKPTMLKKLQLFDIQLEESEENYTFAFPEGVTKGLKLLVNVSAEYAKFNENVKYILPISESALFKRGIFNTAENYNLEIFNRSLRNKESFEKAIEYLERNGFKRINDKDMHNSYQYGSLDYVKFYRDKNKDGSPLKVSSAWKTNVYAGIECIYNEMDDNPIIIRCHIPFLREVLENQDKMDEDLKWFFQWNRCSGCGCCTMNNAKTKALKFITIGNVNCCSLYAFGYAFNNIGYETQSDKFWFANHIKKVMEFIDGLFKDRLVDLEDKHYNQ